MFTFSGVRAFAVPTKRVLELANARNVRRWIVRGIVKSPCLESDPLLEHATIPRHCASVLNLLDFVHAPSGPSGAPKMHFMKGRATNNVRGARHRVSVLTPLGNFALTVTRPACGTTRAPACHLASKKVVTACRKSAG